MGRTQAPTSGRKVTIWRFLKTSISVEVGAPNSLTEFAQGGAILKTIS